MNRIKILLVGGLTGLLIGPLLYLLIKLLSVDNLFELWEFSISMILPGVIAVLIARITGTRILIVTVVAYLTVLIPLLGPMFGGTGSEPVWAFGVLGLIGGAIWSIPFWIWSLFFNRKS